jgi:bifunctional DNA-binding transcriptional regulator/antitoxin component of YhaV-PrlF toxin-antitoxin module
MTMVLIHEQTTVGSDGTISLPTHILEASGFQAGDALAVWWIPPDQIILRKLEAVQSPEAFDRAMNEFGKALRTAGYDTDEEVIELVREIKREQAQEWFESQGRSWPE